MLTEQEMLSRLAIHADRADKHKFICRLQVETSIRADISAECHRKEPASPDTREGNKTSARVTRHPRVRGDTVNSA
jgi:hypothetical protein